MAAFKDKKNGSWYVQFRYTDWRGERQQKLKRGFATKKEAQAWEREFLMQKKADVNMSFESFVALYEKDVKPKLKLNTWLSKEHIIRTKILPYFKKRKLSEITARDVIDWQNEIRQHTKSSGESYSPDYLKNVHTQLSCIFNHAIKYYSLLTQSLPPTGNTFLISSFEVRTIALSSRFMKVFIALLPIASIALGNSVLSASFFVSV